MYQILENKFYLENNSCDDKYLIQMRSQAKSSSIKLPEVHGVRKNLDPNLKPGKQYTLPKQGSLERLHISQGRAGSKRKRHGPINHAINQASNLSQVIHGRSKIEKRKINHVNSTDLMCSINNTNDKMANSNPLIPDVAFHPGPIYRPPPKPKQNMTHVQSTQSSNVRNINPDINFNFEESHHFKKASCPRHSKHQTSHSFRSLKN